MTKKNAKKLMQTLSVLPLVYAAIFLLPSCASNPKQNLPYNAHSYYEDTISDFSTAELSNGIPVIFKQYESKTAWIGLIIDGGVALYTEDKSGLEDITLNLMLHGSESFPYNEIQRLEFEKSFSISATAGKDYSVISTRFIQRDLNDALSLFSDSILHPTLSEADFTTIMTEEAEALQRTLSNPSGVLGLELTKAAFSRHPYATSTAVTAQSISKITLEDVQNHYISLLDASRLSFVVVGDFSSKAQKKLLTLLDTAFGTISRSSFTKTSIPPLEASSKTIYAVSDVAADTGYIAGYFTCPERTTEDYVAFAIALMYLDDILFKQVREQHGAVYSIGSGVFGGKQLLGAISVYKATEKKQLQHYIYEAIEDFPSEEEIEKTLDEYKNKYITTLFSSSQNITGVAGNVVASLAYYQNATQYLNRAEQVQNITAQDVSRIYRRYLTRNPEKAENGQVSPICWIIVSGEESVYTFTFE